jgi:antirestriction protein ArdC
MRRYLAVMGRFARYSLGNQLLIALQRPDATHVAGYRAWQKLGRQVKQGERGITILAPIRVRQPDPRAKDADRPNRADDESGQLDTAGESVVAFKGATVFDVSATNGEPLPEFARVDGDPSEFMPRLQAFVAAQGISLEYSTSLGAALGASIGKRILLRPDLSPAESFSTLVHEFAHSELHIETMSPKPDKTVRETEAEAVAFVVCQSMGLDTNTAASDYIRLYNGEKKTLMESLTRIRTVAVEIIEAIKAPRAKAAPTITEMSMVQRTAA